MKAGPKDGGMKNTIWDWLWMGRACACLFFEDYSLK